MRVEVRIAWRYLFARKRHNVINLVSAIAAAGMAVGSAALVVVMSVYGGFSSLIDQMMGTYAPQVKIVPAEGKSFHLDFDSPLMLCIDVDEDVLSYSFSIEEKVFANYDGKNSVVLAKGVDQPWAEESPLRGQLIAGDFQLYSDPDAFEGTPYCLVGVGLAQDMEINPRFLTPLNLYYPDAAAKVSSLNPASALHSLRCFPSAVFSVSSDIDKNTLILPLDALQALLGYADDEVGCIEVRLKDGVDVAAFIKKLSLQEGVSQFKILDRYAQNTSLYRMMRYEKAAIYLILVFILIIVALNIFASLRMLQAEKREDIGTLSALGLKGSGIRRVFVLVGVLVSMLGMMAGLVLGIGVVLLQMYTGFVRMPGGFAVTSYPVVLSWPDLLLSITLVLAIGFAISLISYCNNNLGYKLM